MAYYSAIKRVVVAQLYECIKNNLLYTLKTYTQDSN